MSHFVFLFFISQSTRYFDHIGGVMFGVLASSAIDGGFKPRSGQTKDYEIGICCFSAKYAALRRRSKDCLVQNQNNVSEWSDMSTHRLLFQWASAIKIQLRVLGLVLSGHHHHFIECNLFSSWYSWKITELTLNNNHSLAQQGIWNDSQNSLGKYFSITLQA